MNVEIRKALPQDHAAGVRRLSEQIAAQHLAGRPQTFRADRKHYEEADFLQLLTQEDRPIFVAADDSARVVGYAFCILQRLENHPALRDCTFLHVDDLCVDEACRRQGIGRKLLDTASAHAKENRASYIDLNVWDFNEDAIRFYERCGFSGRMRRMERGID